MKLRTWRRQMTRRDTGFVRSVDRLMELIAHHSNKLSKSLQEIYQKSLQEKQNE